MVEEVEEGGMKTQLTAMAFVPRNCTIRTSHVITHNDRFSYSCMQHHMAALECITSSIYIGGKGNLCGAASHRAVFLDVYSS